MEVGLVELRDVRNGRPCIGQVLGRLPPHPGSSPCARPRPPDRSGSGAAPRRARWPAAIWPPPPRLLMIRRESTLHILLRDAPVRTAARHEIDVDADLARQTARSDGGARAGTRRRRAPRRARRWVRAPARTPIDRTARTIRGDRCAPVVPREPSVPRLLPRPAPALRPGRLGGCLGRRLRWRSRLAFVDHGDGLTRLHLVAGL